MSSTPKRQPPAGGQSPNKPPSNATPATKTPSRSSTPSTANSVARGRPPRSGPNGSPMSAKAAARKPGTASALTNATSADDENSEDDRRAETVALIDDLKEQLQKAEAASEEYRKQSEILQARLDDAMKDQSRFEEKSHEDDERIEGLENEKKELTRQRRELDTIYEGERSAWIREKEEATLKEGELQGVIQRMKESLLTKDMRGGDSKSLGLRIGDSPDLEGSEGGHFAPRSSLQRSNSSNTSKLVMQKDKIIESLRLELAEAQIKMAELENMGGGRLQELEKSLLETRMANARLMEDNESFQLLLSERTLNGDFHTESFAKSRPPSSGEKRSSQDGTKASSLADELESAQSDDNNADPSRRLQVEIQSLKDQNKALTLYIEKIIDRLLTHKGLETVLDQTPDLLNGPGHSGDRGPPPPPKDNLHAGPSLLERAKSVVSRTSEVRPKPRPQSVIQPPSTLPPPPSLTEDQDTAPSIPLQRSQSTRAGPNKRSTIGGYADVISNMYKGPPPVVGPSSPGLSSPRGSFFGSRAASGQSVPTISENMEGDEDGDMERELKVNEDALSALSGHSAGSAGSGAGGREGEMGSSPPRSSLSGLDKDKAGGKVFAGGKMRPLSLVPQTTQAQAQVDQEDAARKAANRGSWMGWLNKGKIEGVTWPGSSG